MSDIRDPQIRAALANHLAVHSPRAVVLHEIVIRYVGLHGSTARADVVAVDEHLHGFEIKSDGDSFARLRAQIAGYGGLFDFCTLVVGPRHLAHAEAVLPPSWAILVAETASNAVVLRTAREGARNERVDPRALARQLWKGECIDLLRANGVRLPARSYVHDIWPRIEALPLDVVRARVRAAVLAHREEA